MIGTVAAGPRIGGLEVTTIIGICAVEVFARVSLGAGELRDLIGLVGVSMQL